MPPDLTFEKLRILLLVVLPGVIAIKVYDLFHPPEKRDFGSSILEAAAYGVINLALWFWPIQHLNQEDYLHKHPVWYAFWHFCFLVLSPVGLALAALRGDS